VKEYVMEIILYDLNRHYNQKTYITVNNRTTQSPVNFLLVNSADSVPIFTTYISSETQLSILCRDRISKQMYVRYFNRQFPLAAPATKLTELEKFNYRSDATYTIDLNASNEFSFKERGIYHFQHDSTILQGLTIYRFNDDYPGMTQANELVEPLRYLTTSREFNKIINSHDKKAAIDEFWLDIAGNKTKGRELIKIFYTRVEEANRYFTSYHEGWKTDRGLIFIIFGEPDVVYRSSKHEDWNYSGTFEHGPVNFTFEKVSNPFTDQDYNLQRSQIYESIWYMAVDEWRQGRQMEIE
jgi:GWxTD domain-containing protein